MNSLLHCRNWGSSLNVSYMPLCLLFTFLALAQPQTAAALGTEPGQIIGRVLAVFEGATILSKTPGSKPVAVVKGMPVELGDRMTTDARGRVRIQFADRNEELKAGPSILNLGPASEAVFDKFDVELEERHVGLRLIVGKIRSFFKGWGRNSAFDVRCGVAICGIRGSDVIIMNYKEAAMGLVREGSMTMKGPNNRVDIGPGQVGSLVSDEKQIVKLSPWDVPDIWDTLISEIEPPLPQ